jgi:DNA-3-methyladenine glycosylase II
VKAAETIFLRLKRAAGGRILPARIAALSQNQAREVGLSSAKFKTIQGIATAALTREIKINKLHEKSDEDIFRELTSLWGVGPWTVDMFMMFQLGRLDIWPTGDLGVRRGWEKIHRLESEIAPSELEIKGEKYRPYRSVIAWYCWRSLG